jgi:hypothetical protein
MRSHLGVAVGFMATAADGRVEQGRALRAVGKVLGRLIDARADWRQLLHLIERSLRAHAQGNASASTAWRYVRDWAAGHFLDVDFEGPEPPSEDA